MGYGELNLQPIPKMANGRFRKGDKPHNKVKNGANGWTVENAKRY